METADNKRRTSAPINRNLFTLIIILVIPVATLILYYPALFTYFSQDDFFHFKVSLTDGSLDQFINLFGFHPFLERGIAFYRPLFREGLFNIFYSLFGLNPYPFRIMQFFLLFINSLLAFYLVNRLFNNKLLSYFVAFYYAISSAQVSPLYYLAGGVQVLGGTTFLLLTLILFIKKSPFSFLTFLFALASHELTSIIPFLITILIFTQYPLKKALKKLWQVVPFFLVLFTYLYWEITKIGLPAGEKQYHLVFSLKTTLNSFMWYLGWALGLPEMLVDFVFPGFKLNPSLMRYWSNYYLPIFTTFFISLTILTIFTVFLLLKKRKIIFNKNLFFFFSWFFIGLFPVILLPLHKSTQYLETSLIAFWTIIGFIAVNTYKNLRSGKILLAILLLSLFILSATSAILQRTTYWAAQRGKFAEQLIKNITFTYPVLPKGSIIYFKNDPNYPYLTKEWGNSSKQASIILNGSDALQLLYKDPTLKVYYEDLKSIEFAVKNIYPIIAKIY